MLRTRILALALGLYMLFGGIIPPSMAIDPSDTLLPNTTRGFLSVHSVKTLEDHWNKTQLGQLAKDPVMKPFVDDLHGQVEDRWSELHDRLGVTIGDLRDVAGGEVAIAAVQPADGRPAVAIVVDVTGKGREAKALMAKIIKTLTALKAEHTREEVEGVGVEVFKLPPEESAKLPKEFSAAPKGKEKAKAKPAEPPDRYTFCCLNDDLLAGSTHREVLQGILARAAGKKGPTLSEVGSYQAVMKRCGEDAGKAVPHVRWYVQPLGYLELMRIARLESQPDHKGRNVPQFFTEQGFDAVEGLGGFVDFGVEGYEAVHRTAVYAPGEYRQSMKILRFPNSPKPGDPKPGDPKPGGVKPADPKPGDLKPGDLKPGGVKPGGVKPGDPKPGDLKPGGVKPGDPKPGDLKPGGVKPDGVKPGDLKPTQDQFAPQRWVPMEIATYATFLFDVLGAFDNLDPLADAMFHEKGAWKRALIGLKEDQHGPRINLRKELVEHLGERISVLTDYDYQGPITTSERLLIAVEVKKGEDKAMADGIAKYYKNDREMRKREFEGHVVWEGIPPEKGKDEVPGIDIDFGLPGAKKPVRPRGKGQEHLFPNLAVTVANGHLFIASHYGFLTKVLGKVEARVKSGDTLADSIEYQQVTKALDQFVAKARCARSFTNTDEQYRATYELVRQNKMPESQTMLGRILNSLFGTGKKGVRRKQEIDGSKLPDYDIVRRRLGPGGFQATTEEQGAFRGWFLKGFILPKGST